MNSLRNAAQAALEALGLAKLNGKSGLHPAEIGEIADAITALKAALAEPVQEPLTDDEIADAANSVRWSQQYHVDFARAIERAHGIGGQE